MLFSYLWTVNNNNNVAYASCSCFELKICMLVAFANISGEEAGDKIKKPRPFTALFMSGTGAAVLCDRKTFSCDFEYIWITESNLKWVQVMRRIPATLIRLTTPLFLNSTRKLMPGLTQSLFYFTYICIFLV